MNNPSKQSLYRRTLLFIALIFSIAVLLPGGAQADTYSLAATLYQSNKDNGHSLSTGKVDHFSYGSKVGSIYLSNVQEQGTPINGFNSYLSDGPISIGCSFNENAYLDTEIDEWHLVSESGKTFTGHKLSEKIKMGALIVQLSSSGKTFGPPVLELENLFTNKKVNRSSLYTIPKENLIEGTYIRVSVAYEMEKKVGEKDSLFGGDVYDYLYCTEVYEFYVGFNGDTVQFRDIITGNVVHSGEEVQSGFIIDKRGSSNSLRIKNGQDDWDEVQSLTSVTEPGDYLIEVTTVLGKKYTYSIAVTDGLFTAPAKPTVYQNIEKDKYILGTPQYYTTTFGLTSLTTLTVAQSDGKNIATAEYAGSDGYGITGSSVYLLLNLNNAENLKGDWQIVSDTWGRKDSERIEGVNTGPVDTGALIIQTSTDGSKWINANNGRYASGLYTTDFVTHYGGLGDIPIYLPSGEDINNGVFVRILYAYEIENKALKVDYRCVEKYEIYLCNDNLDAVTFHNLSLTDDLEERFGEFNENEAKTYRQAETMRDGDYTAAGFTIDLSSNPKADYKVKRNGEEYSAIDGKFSETGRYDIEITSKVGTMRNLTLYVDSMSKEEALSYYFGDPPFITGKRIYHEGSYPRYEGGQTQYSLAAVDDYHLPLSGYILNLKTMEKTEIPATREAKTGSLTEAGTYEAVFATREEGFSSGDRKIFTFRFELIAEGTAPGPVINQQKLKEYAGTTVSDAYPLFYALRFQGFPKGIITLAFQNEDDAYNYAYNYESGMVENWDSVEEFIYSESYIINEKTEYDGWELADALKDSARKAIQTGCFDLTKIYKVTTIDPEYIKEHLYKDDIANETEYERGVITDLRELYLERSITLFAPGQKEKLTSINEAPFLISDKPYYYLDPVEGGTVSSGFTHFEFCRDTHGYDSDRVTITDQNGKIYEINYGESVGAQLAAAGCPSGLVTITEQTIYGDTASYEAKYIEAGVNTAVISLSCYQSGKENTYTLNQGDDGTHLAVDAIKSFQISDTLDPYDLVIIEKDNAESTYVLDQFDELGFEEVGTYKIKIINRLGASFSFSIDVIDPDFAVIAFAGEGTETLSDTPTRYGAQHVILPVLQREGYNLIGFEDQSGALHSGQIEEITFRGEQILNTVWKAKTFKATFYNPDGSSNTIDVEFDSQITLPTPEVPEGKKFDGWMVDGKILENNLYTLKSENDITFVASVSDKSAVMQAIHNLTNYAEEHTVVTVAITIGVLVLIMILIGKGRSRARRRGQ